MTRFPHREVTKDCTQSVRLQKVINNIKKIIMKISRIETLICSKLREVFKEHMQFLKMHFMLLHFWYNLKRGFMDQRTKLYLPDSIRAWIAAPFCCRWYIWKSDFGAFLLWSMHREKGFVLYYVANPWPLNYRELLLWWLLLSHISSSSWTVLNKTVKTFI